MAKQFFESHLPSGELSWPENRRQYRRQWGRSVGSVEGVPT